MSKLCEICGTEIPEGEEFVVDGQVLCHEHFDEMYAECDDCGAVCRRDQLTEVAGGDLVCDDCLDRDYVCCGNCGEYVPDGDLHVVNRGYRDELLVCENCLDEYFRCDDCREYFSDNHLSANDYRDTLCESCIDYYRTCNNCGELLHENDAYYDEYEDEYYCEDCYHDRCHNGIRDYGYKPNPVFGTTDGRDGWDTYDGSELTFGVELECDRGNNPGRTASLICGITDRLYCKHDGSLTNGYEVVTHPGTLAWHMERFPWERVCDISRSNGFKSHDAGTCGLHIHIGRAQLGGTWLAQDKAVANMVVLSDVLWPEVLRFSRRDGENHYAECNHCAEALDDYQPGDERAAVEQLLNEAYRRGRYVAVNTQNSNTVELRFNRGSLVPATIYASLQLASNLAEFAMTHTLDECLDAKWDDVIHIHEYEELNAYVAKRFDGWVSSEYRPTVRFRVNSSQVQKDTEDDLLSFENRCKLVTDGATMRLEGDTPREGDLVVLTRAANPHITGHGYPRVGSVGVVIRREDDGWDLIMLNDTEAETHNGGIDGIAPRCFFVPREDYRIVTQLRNGTATNPPALLYMAKEHGLVPGDKVRAGHNDKRFNSGVLYYAANTMLDHVTAYAAWPRLRGGHDGRNDTLRSTPFSGHGWNYNASDLELNA